MEIKIPFRSNPGAYKVQGSPKLVNAFMELGGPDQKSPYTLTPCAGLKSFGSSDMGGRCRGMIYLEDEDLIYTVQGFSLYKVTESGTVTRIARMPGQDDVYIARNDALDPDIVIISSGQVFVLKDDTLTTKIDYDFTPVGVTFVGGYFFFWTAEGRIYASNLLSTEVPAERFVTAESDPDGLTFCKGIGNTLYAVGTRTTEVWAINGGSSYPLSKVQGAHLNLGSLSPHSAQEFNNHISWIGNDNVVYEVSGYTAAPISTGEVSRLIESETDKSQIVCFTHQRGENKFLTVSGSTWCREYNSVTKFWHDRVSQINDRWRAVHHVRAWNRDFFGDRLSGYLLESDGAIFTENGGVQAWGFDTSTIHALPRAISFQSMTFEAETGDGISLTEEGFMMLSYSDDDGRTFRGERHLSLGKTGEYGKRVKTYGLGQCKPNGRVFRVRITDPVIRSISNIDVDAEPVAQ